MFYKIIKLRVFPQVDNSYETTFCNEYLIDLNLAKYPMIGFDIDDCDFESRCIEYLENGIALHVAISGT